MMEKEYKFPMIAPAGDRNFHLIELQNGCIIFCEAFYKTDGLICMRDTVVKDYVYPTMYRLEDCKTEFKSTHAISLDDKFDPYVWIYKSFINGEISNVSNSFGYSFDGMGITEEYGRSDGFISIPFEQFKGAKSYKTREETNLLWPFRTKEDAIEEANKKQAKFNETVVQKAMDEISNNGPIRIPSIMQDHLHAKYKLQNRKDAVALAQAELDKTRFWEYRIRKRLIENQRHYIDIYVQESEKNRYDAVTEKMTINLGTLKAKVKEFLLYEDSDAQIGIHFSEFVTGFNFGDK